MGDSAKSSKIGFRRLPVVVGSIAGVVVLVVTLISIQVLYRKAEAAFKDEVRDNLIRTAYAATSLVDGDTHLNFKQGEENTISYQHAIEPLRRLLDASPDIKYIYTCILKGDQVYFVLDPTPPGDEDGDGVDDKSYILQSYDEAAEDIRNALKQQAPVASAEPSSDRWGMFLSGYAPIRNSKGEFVGVVGVDITADHYQERLGGMKRAKLNAIYLAIGLACAVGVITTLVQKRFVAQAQLKDRHYALVNAQDRVLMSIATGATLSVVLDELCVQVERLIPGIKCSILLLDGNRLRHGAAPSLPEEYVQAMDGVEIGLEVGSCGRAAYLGERVITKDISVSPLWANYREFVLSLGFRACWSEPIKDKDGKVLGTFGIYYPRPLSSPVNYNEMIGSFAHIAAIAIQNATTRTQLEASETRLSAVVENMVDALIVINEQGIVEVFNPAAEQLFGYQEEEVIGKNITMLMPEPYRSQHADYLQNYLKTGVKKVIGAEHQAEGLRSSGEHFPVSLSVSEMWVNGERKFIGTVRDITERKTAEQAIMQANNELKSALQRARELAIAAEDANKAKSAFLANMSHEIRTPMNGVLGMAELLMDTPLDEEQNEYIRTLKSSAEGLLTLIDDLLDFSKIEAGKMSLEQIPCDLEAIAQETVRLFTPRAQSKGLKLRAEICVDSSRRVISDPVRLRQILSNFVSNAVKFTDAGEVIIRVEKKQPEEGLDHYWLAVSDTGIGIAKDKQELIFESFSQADSSTTRHYGGTGLGLSICKKITELMGGKIGVDSQPGQGSTFWVEVPLVECELLHSEDGTQGTGSSSWDASIPDSSGVVLLQPLSFSSLSQSLHVLLVEDNAVNRQVAVRMLEKLGCRVDIAVNGEEAVAKWEQNSYHFVLMDVQMPVMDGLEATWAIRQKELQQGGHTLIIAMTANAMQGDRERCLESGMDDYVSKPVSIEALKAIIAKVRARNVDREDGKTGRREKREERQSKIRHLQSEIIDDAYLHEMTGGDKGFRQQILQEFLQSSSGLLAQANGCLQPGDWSNFIRAVHTLKGSARTIGANAFADAAAALEKAGRENRVDEIPALMGNLWEQWELLEQMVNIMLKKAA